LDFPYPDLLCDSPPQRTQLLNVTKGKRNRIKENKKKRGVGKVMVKLMFKEAGD